MIATLLGILLGLAAVAVNFGLLYFGVRRLFGRSPDRVKLIIPAVYVLRYLLFGAMIFVTLRFRLGSAAGLLIGVTAGIAGFMLWQVINARRTRSS
jgi:hypothetical protein